MTAAGAMRIRLCSARCGMATMEEEGGNGGTAAVSSAALAAAPAPAASASASETTEETDAADTADGEPADGRAAAACGRSVW